MDLSLHKTEKCPYQRVEGPERPQRETLATYCHPLLSRCPFKGRAWLGRREKSPVEGSQHPIAQRVCRPAEQPHPGLVKNVEPGLRPHPGPTAWTPPFTMSISCLSVSTNEGLPFSPHCLTSWRTGIITFLYPLPSIFRLLTSIKVNSIPFIQVESLVGGWGALAEVLAVQRREEPVSGPREEAGR